MTRELGVKVGVVYMDEDCSRSTVQWTVELVDRDGCHLADASADSLGEAFEQAYLVVAHEALV